MSLSNWMKFGRGGRPLRIAYGRIFHEANAYSPLLTDFSAFDHAALLKGDELARGATLGGSELPGFFPHAELTGFVQAARAAGNVEAVPLASYIAVPSGPVTVEAFERILEDQIERLKQAMPVDGVYLALHGSMEVKGLGEQPESVILRRVREVLGPGPRIAASFDLHANLTDETVKALDVLIGYRSNPHWDLAPTGFRAGNRLIRALRGEIRPVHAWRKLPMVLGGGTTIDFLDPMRKVFRHMKRLERDPRVLSATLFMVHPYTSADDLGWAVHVTTDGDEALANSLAEEVADKAWTQRFKEPPPMLNIEQAIRDARASSRRKFGPVTMIDIDDIVGAGAPGGNTQLIRGLLEHGQDLIAYVPLHDPALVEATWELPIGSEHTLTLRGTEGYDMPEVTVRATIAARIDSDMGRKVRLDVGKLSIAVMEKPPLPIHPRYWREIDLDPRKADVIVQKNFFHYRMFYAAISFDHLPVVSSGATSFGRVRERKYFTPVHPETHIEDWRQYDTTLRMRRAAKATELQANK
ncbi:MAG: M81 family metallopeptidase [Deltaproteobacteria bacterium]|nr:M81 family metallopeptidase [Deltaproteobacteria bacterium]